MHNSIFLLTLLISGLFSAPVNQESAEQVARNLFIERGPVTEFDIRSIQPISDGDLDLYYIFHLDPIKTANPFAVDANAEDVLILSSVWKSKINSPLLFTP